MISILIATRDRAALLSTTLDALLALDDPGCPIEIVVVENASSDDTPAVVARAARRSTVPVRYVREERAGKSYALNTGLAHAAGDLLVLTDDDVLPGPNWLAAYVRAFAETGADYAAGRILPLWEASPPRWMSTALYGVLAIPDGGMVRLPLGAGLNEEIMPIGANMAVRRRVIDRIGGWNTSLGKLHGTLRTGEDHEFALRMTRAGFRGVYVPEAVVRHRVPPDRLRIRYFHRWFLDNGAIVAGIEDAFPTKGRSVLMIPGYMWRQAARAIAGTVRGALTLNSATLVAAAMRLTWFAGYVRARWRARPSRRTTARAERARAALPRG